MGGGLSDLGGDAAEFGEGGADGGRFGVALAEGEVELRYIANCNSQMAAWSGCG